MSTHLPDPERGRPVGRFEVMAARADIEAFRAAAALPLDGVHADRDVVPPTYPFRWIGLPEIRAALRAIEGVNGGYPIHMGQKLSYIAPIVPDSAYQLDVSWHAHHNRPDQRMTLEIFATALDTTGKAIVHMASVILIVPPSEAIR